MTTMERKYTPQEIEREAETSRQRLSSTLDELRDNLTPGHIVEELLDNAKDGGASMLRALGKAARENPLPTLLIGTGCAMFLMGAGGSGGTAEPRDGRRRDSGYGSHRYGSSAGSAHASYPDRAYGDRSDTAGLAEIARDKTGAAMETVSETVSAAYESVGDTASRIGERAKQAAESASETYHEASNAAIEGARHAGEQVRQTVSRSSEKIRENFSALLNEQPLVLGALGVAIGAALGALLPRSETEDRLLGQTSDELKGAAAKIASEQYDLAKETAAKVADEVREIAEDHGLTTDNASDAVGEVGRRVKEAAGVQPRT